MTDPDEGIEQFTHMIAAVLRAAGLPAEPVAFDDGNGTVLPGIADADDGRPVLFVASEALRVILARALLTDDDIDAAMADEIVPDYVPDEWTA
jgi:hypothetical protein